jgi:hypothetical protein
MSHSRPLIAGLMRLPVRDFAAFGGDTQPRKDGVMRPRLASLHPPCALCRHHSGSMLAHCGVRGGACALCSQYCKGVGTRCRRELLGLANER